MHVKKFFFALGFVSKQRKNGDIYMDIVMMTFIFKTNSK